MLYELVRYWVMTTDECARLRLVVPAEMTVSSNSLPLIGSYGCIITV